MDDETTVMPLGHLFVTVRDTIRCGWCGASNLPDLEYTDDMHREQSPECYTEAGLCGECSRCRRQEDENEREEIEREQRERKRAGLTVTDVRRLTLFKWRYSLESQGFDTRTAETLLFFKWLVARGRLES